MSDVAATTSGRLALVWVTGPDAVPFLDGLLSQNIAAISIGGTARSLLLAPNGKLRAILFVLRGPDRVGLVCDSAVGDAVVADLRRFKIRVDVEIAADAGPIWEQWGIAGPDSVLESGYWVEEGPFVRFRLPFQRAPLERVVWTGPRPDGEIVDPAELEAFRIELGEPVVGRDLDEKTIPQEAVAVADYVDFTKGCYLGQELVARIDSRGHVNRRLVGLTVASGELVPTGTEIVHSDRVVGTVTSSAWSTRQDTMVALAMVRTEVAVGSAVVVAGAVGEVVDLPMSS